MNRGLAIIGLDSWIRGVRSSLQRLSSHSAPSSAKRVLLSTASCRTSRALQCVAEVARRSGRASRGEQHESARGAPCRSALSPARCRAFILRSTARAHGAVRRVTVGRWRGRVAQRVRQKSGGPPSLCAAGRRRRVSARGQRRSVRSRLRVGRDARLDRPRAPRPVNGAAFIAPTKPGYYHLAVVRGDRATDHRRADARGDGAVRAEGRRRRSNGYRIGTYLAERLGRNDHPDGFLEVRPATSISRSARIFGSATSSPTIQADVWPKYMALNPRLLDKLELVLAKDRCACDTAASRHRAASGI